MVPRPSRHIAFDGYPMNSSALRLASVILGATIVGGSLALATSLPAGAFEERPYAWLPAAAQATTPASPAACGFVASLDMRPAALYPATVAPRYRPTPSTPRPAYMQSTVDPTFGTRVVRVSDSAGVRHRYSSKSAWNADGSLLLLDFKDGSREVRHGRDFTLLRRNVATGSYFSWSNRDPRIGYSGGPGTSPQIRKHRISGGGEFSVTHTSNMMDIAGWSEMSFGGGQGSPSNRDLMAVTFKKRNGTWGVAVVDLKRAPVRVVSQRVFGTTSRPIQAMIDNVGMSQTGRWVSIVFTPDGTGVRQGVWLYRRNLAASSRVQVLRQEEHWDWARNKGGKDVFVYRAGRNDVTEPGVYGYNTANGRQRLLVPGVSGNLHLSGRNVRQPGWVYVSSTSAGTRPGHGVVFAVNLADPRKVRYFAHHHHSRNLGYGSEVHASASPNGRFVIFASEWGGSQVHAYVASAR